MKKDGVHITSGCLTLIALPLMLNSSPSPTFSSAYLAIEARVTAPATAHRWHVVVLISTFMSSYSPCNCAGMLRSADRSPK